MDIYGYNIPEVFTNHGTVYVKSYLSNFITVYLS